ncbi:MAG: hypothetical protein CVT65_18230 [Actinobacteria bacterium HGW-Actinobacteria-5]|jgi:hypothetical protein|nr:MAG: hypothetical protein CVT65_18230 [Actinobacteria bacterium HGW-Actinobacteria-5]
MRASVYHAFNVARIAAGVIFAAALVFLLFQGNSLDTASTLGTAITWLVWVSGAVCLSSWTICRMYTPRDEADG